MYKWFIFYFRLLKIQMPLRMSSNVQLFLSWNRNTQLGTGNDSNISDIYSNATDKISDGYINKTDDCISYVRRLRGYQGNPAVAIVSISSLVLNVLVILVLRKMRKRRPTGALIHLSFLAVSDLAVGLSYVSYGALIWTRGPFDCWTCGPYVCGSKTGDRIQWVVFHGLVVFSTHNKYVTSY